MTVDGKMFGTFFDGHLTADGNVKRDKTDKVSKGILTWEYRGLQGVTKGYKGIETGRFDTSVSSETEQQLR